MTDGVVVITRAVRRMGLACGQRLVDRGHPILVGDRQARVGEIARLLGAAGAEVEWTRCDHDPHVGDGSRH